MDENKKANLIYFIEKANKNKKIVLSIGKRNNYMCLATLGETDDFTLLEDKS
ncbi:MAG: hypothetical protein KKF48_03930 [Nanoarchaeota archaeon]|nr:hypothetical protein [Nanoarchaeota archaeon]MBU1028167.1 hypothetical protein [Nanoarchaeota archaeon]